MFFMIFIGMFQGALLFAGLALTFNVIVFTSTNWGFILLLTIIGAALGTLAGFLLHGSAPANVWALPLGSVLVVILVGVFAMAFDFFIFGSDQMHWRGILALSLISSAPGLVVGWILGQQLPESGTLGLSTPTSRFPDSARLSNPQSTFPPPREPLPLMQSTSEYQDIRSQHLVRTLGVELGQFPPDISSSPPQPVGSSGSMCVTATVSGRGQQLKLYLVCTLDYPQEPPQLMIEQIDQLQGTSSQVSYRSQVIQNWRPNNRLYEVVNEVYQYFTG
jgi:hypothetical protein